MQEGTGSAIYCTGLDEEDAANLYQATDLLENYASEHREVSVWLYGSAAYLVESDEVFVFGEESGGVEEYADIDLLVERNFHDSSREKIISHEAAQVQEIVGTLEEDFEPVDNAVRMLESRGEVDFPSRSDPARGFSVKQEVNGTVFDILFSRFDPGGTYDSPGRAHLLGG